ncbi:amino acid/polyamine/organocation transporter (APC superfamily) [Rhizobium sp. PP-F2F-G38]|uniref:APC family permease n=1 Tax=Ferranicluibacter rubi TaxID=2715133 RepID=A0AA43ZGD1_9HYPH|nr:APC family permease [Ferranicluibacter rubi]NHT77099.1 APC family permease [Ferranicluibacter rubi]PYE31444.1 amino acid/polyamine/organocation transporter (APC superfamily) [Rhizobium sp. PP-WC-1G-195]PYE94007.1 amino acid/polyamine/organocation transporter (APC superfamily) [Rhizobium sp. PP-F2F-G38]TCQ20118.1 amino acid/polyamine/organocation transporter (APC superfamily) [Rhizobium sp. PP-CC-3G-465]
MSTTVISSELSEPGKLHRSINWTGAFWVASGVPALVLFSIGGIAGTVGTLAFAVWIVSMIMGFIQSFTYAEIAGLFPNKSGGASIYGASAWVRYAKPIAPLSVWCNWFAWSPVLSLGCSIAAAYILNALAPVPAVDSASVIDWIAANGATLTVPDAEKAAAAISALTPSIRTWTLFQTTLGPVSLSLNAAFFIGAILMLVTFAVQHRGILGTAKVQKYIGLVVIIPMVIVGVVPLVTGGVNWSNFSPLVPLATPYAPEPGAWNVAGWTLVLGGMFIAAWSTYGFETAVCYTSEFRDPGKDTFKAIFFSGLLCLALFSLVPFTFQGVLGLNGMLATPIVDGSGVAAAMAHMVGGGALIESLLVMLMILALMLCLMTAMAGSSRTLYQGSVDGWLPKYLSHVNEHGAPTRAMWTDLIVNLVVLAIACADATSFFFILAVSNCGYIIFNFLNLNAGWLHRIDSGHIARPYRAPTVLLALGGIFAFLNAVFMGAGAKVWNPMALWAGIITAALIIPVFFYRHYIQDRGQFPAQMLEDLGVKPGETMHRKAGMLPYLTLIAGVAVVFLSNWFFSA